MKDAMIWLYMNTNAIIGGMKNFITDEAKRIRDDESGMELLQVILIILFVVVIAAVLWAFLGDWITELLQSIFDSTPEPSESDIVNPFG